jgi:uncharacterized NAD-dependent epimerase/dehydratase family protein
MNFTRHKYLILTQGRTHPSSAKLATGVVRYRPERVVALLDSEQAGKDAFSCLGVGRNIPIVESIQEGLVYKPNALLIGITPPGGGFPPEWRQLINDAIRAGLDIVAGMHTLLSDMPEFVVPSEKYGVQLIDLRRVPEHISVNTCQAKNCACLRIHTVGTDCNCGKKVTALEVNKSLEQLGKRTVFLATGQTGIAISGRGIAMDHVISDFVSGAAESLVLDNRDCDYQLIEGQGALTHPLYSGVTLSMLHGFAPQLLILCHQVGRKMMRGSLDTPVPGIREMIDLYERMATPVFPAKVIGVALNCYQLKTEELAREAVEKTENETGLPTTDVIRFGAEKLVNAIIEFENSQQQQKEYRP